MFLLQRGAAPEVDQPAAPARPRTRARRPAAPPPASPAADVVAGFHAAQAQLAAPPAPAAPVTQPWQPLGPFFMPHGQTYGAGPGSRPPVAGRVAAVAVDPADDKHVLCGSAGGGIWESRDGGRAWAPRTDGQPSLAVGAIAFDPSNPQRVY